METLRNEVIDQIFKLLAPLRSLYEEEIYKITNDLLNNDTKSLEEFINKYYNDVPNTKDFANLVASLANNNLIDNSFLGQIIIPKEVIKQISIRPLNVRTGSLNNIKKNSDLSKLEPTKFPVSLIEKKEETVVETNNTPTPIQQEDAMAIEIEPDYNTEPDIHLSFDSDNESEIPDFNTYQNQDLNKETVIDLPDNNDNFEIPAIETPVITPTPTLEIETPNIISKEEIFESIPTVDDQNSNSINEKFEETALTNDDTDMNNNLKNTTQFGKILQFPYGSYNHPTQSEISVQTTPISQEEIILPTVSVVSNQNTTPTADINPVTAESQVAISNQDTNTNNEVTTQEENTLTSVSDMMNQNTTPEVTPAVDVNQVTNEPELPSISYQDTNANNEVTTQEETALPSVSDMMNQNTTPEVTPAVDINQVTNEPELPSISYQDTNANNEVTTQEETALPSVSDMMNQNTTPEVTPAVDINQVTNEPELPSISYQDTNTNNEVTTQEENTLPSVSDMMNQNTTSEVTPAVDVNQVTNEPELPSIPLPRDMIKDETPTTPQKTEEELRQEIENKVREAVREELKQEISELTNKTKEELKQEISEMATKTKEEVKQELTEKIREEEKNNILRIQNDYMNNATEFIKSLDNKTEEEIYTSLRLLNDLRYMSHCIAHLSSETLERFYLYIERKLNSPDKEFMDTIIEKRIKEILPPNISYNLELEATNSNEVFRKTA